MKRIVITGGTGTIGRALVAKLNELGYSIHILSTQENKATPESNIFFWDPDAQYIEPGALDKVDIVLHLAGANVGKKRWTKNYKKEILESRTKTASLLYKTCVENNIVPKKVISSSGIGYYNDPCKTLLHEGDTNGTHFLATVCAAWENEVKQFEALGSTVTILRTGPVLSAGDGLFKAYTQTAFLRIIPTTGKPGNMLSWVHLNDLVNVFAKAVQNDLPGIYNAVAPNPVSQKQMVKTIASVLHKKCLHPNVPDWALKLAMGEQSDLARTDQIVSCEKLLQTGFVFQYPKIDMAIQQLMLEK